jgi:phospholipid/cholesterol/gamma-HCH transport system substrate-binding protein
VSGATITHWRVLGLALALLLVAGARLAYHYVQELDAGYEVLAVLGESGPGLNVGSDVKVRGVLVGEVIELGFEDGRAHALLEIQRDQRIPRDVDVVVTAKTLLGPKQVELRPDGPLAPPFLEAGDTVAADPDHGPTEVQDVLHELEDIFADIEPDDLATLVDALGAFTVEDGELVARNIDLGAELADFGARTADDQLARIGAMADVVEALAPRAADWNRLARTAPEWASLLPDRQADVRASLDALSSFSIGLAELLEAEEATISRLMVLGDRVGAVIEPRVHEIGTLIQGVYRYTRMFGQHGGSLDDGTEHAMFRVHVGDEGSWGEFCESLPDELREAAPGCVAREDG